MDVTENEQKIKSSDRYGCSGGAVLTNSDTCHHESLYKLRGLSNEELRKRRRISEVQIRKQKQEDFFNNKRRLDNDEVEFTLADDCCIIPKTVLNMIKSGNLQNELAGLKFLRSKIAESAEDVNCMSGLGDISLISHLTRLLIHGDKDLTDDISWILVNMFRRHENRLFTEDIRGQVLPTFCGLIHRAASSKNGNKKLVIIRHIVFLIATLFSDIHEFTPDLIELFPLLPLISRQLSSEDLTIQSDALRACRFMSEYPDFFQPMSDAGIQIKLVSLLPSCSSFVVYESLRSIANVIQETSLYTKDMVNSGLLFNMLPLMSRNTTMREACFVMSNIAAEGNDMLQAVLDVGTLKEIAVLLEVADYETRKEAFYVMYHAATSSRSCHLAAILGADLLSPLCDFLTVLEHSLVADVMEALSALLAYGEQLAIGLTDFLNPVATRMEELGAKEKLEFLCDSHSMRLHVAAHELLEKYFSSLDDFELTTQHAVSMRPYSGERDSMDETIDMIVKSVCL
ncbi:unnamed protein product [Angiostrongylus costaricensis]|uniref:IBB domain-containing protein n=1 Tax=Angiostrongylus costaricensis TaxID=334426 RepID=A0A0R3PQ34_ANGCS|nr:unnamed protein product [Angiostrongylus costaricensis]